MENDFRVDLPNQGSNGSNCYGSSETTTVPSQAPHIDGKGMIWPTSSALKKSQFMSEWIPIGASLSLTDVLFQDFKEALD